MNPEILRTADGSDTLFVPELGESYHSLKGAIQESRHVFIETGLTPASEGKASLNILETGFGTGLNALLTFFNASVSGPELKYTAVESFPLTADIWMRLNYPEVLGEAETTAIFTRMHQAPWGQTTALNARFMLEKLRLPLEDYIPGVGLFDLIYFDAFSPQVQPELWTPGIFIRMFEALVPGGILVTYSVQGQAIRAMQSAGFRTEKLPGPPGKRHITRAIK